MSKKSLSKKTYSDLARLEKMADAEIDLSDIPEVSEEQLAGATIRLNGIPLSKGKVRVNIFLDEAVVAYFKSSAGGRGYQTLINETLKQSMLQDNLEKKLRRIIREELKNAG